MQLLPDEEILVTSNQDKIVLTSQRVHLKDKEWGRSYQITLFLENISSIENVYKKQPGPFSDSSVGTDRRSSHG